MSRLVTLDRRVKREFLKFTNITDIFSVSNGRKLRHKIGFYSEKILGIRFIQFSVLSVSSFKPDCGQ